MTTPPAWPARPATADQYHLTEGHDGERALPDQEPAHAVIGQLAGLLLQTRGNMLMGSGLLGGIAIGIALEAGLSARTLPAGPFRLIDIALMGGLAICWLTAASLLALAGRPVLRALTRLRCGTGAPLDPRAGWLTLPPLGANPDEWAWNRAHLLIGAARLARSRLQLADTWSYVTAACFLAWTAVVILGR
jgi:hypothetical protein